VEENEQKLSSDENLEESQDNTTLAVNKNTIDTQTSIDPAVIEELKASQSLTGAVLGGILGATLGAALWSIVTAVTKYQIGFLALGIGVLTGFLVRKLGHGLERHYGYIGAAFSFLGCLIGNIIAVLIMISYQESISFSTLLQLLDFNILTGIIRDTFSARGLLFYVIAIIEGYKFSFITRDDVHKNMNRVINSDTV
jgi:hypothetical protein